MSAPQRIQRKRTKGWRMPEGAVYVGRPSYWGNIFKVGTRTNRAYGSTIVENRAHAVELFEKYLARNPIIASDAQKALAGRDLACWCPLDEPCHADVLLEIAQSEAAGSKP